MVVEAGVDVDKGVVEVEPGVAVVVDSGVLVDVVPGEDWAPCCDAPSEVIPPVRPY